MVWRTPKEDFSIKCTVATVKHGGRTMVCWGYFSSSEVANLVFIDGNMIGNAYRNILDKKSNTISEEFEA